MNRRQFAALVAASGALVEALPASRAQADTSTQYPGELGQPAIPYILVDGKIKPLCTKPGTVGDVLSMAKLAEKDGMMSFLSLRPLFLHPNSVEFRERTKDAASLTITFSQRQSNIEKIKPQQWTQVITLIPVNNRRDVQAQSVVGITGLFDNIPVGPFGGALSIEFKSSQFAYAAYSTYQRIAAKLRTLTPEAGSAGLGAVSPALAVGQTSIEAASAALNLFDAVFEALASDSRLDTHFKGFPRNVAIEELDVNNLREDPMTLVIPKGESTLIFVPGSDPTIKGKDTRGIAYSGSSTDNDHFLKYVVHEHYTFALDPEGRITSLNSDAANVALENVTYLTMNAVVFPAVRDNIPNNVPPPVTVAANAANIAQPAANPAGKPGVKAAKKPVAKAGAKHAAKTADRPAS